MIRQRSREASVLHIGDHKGTLIGRQSPDKYITSFAGRQAKSSSNRLADHYKNL
jgi:hypothetical protein